MTPTTNTFEAFFQTATGTAPYRYQIRLAEQDPLPDVLDVPTGLGKTAAVALAWLWRRVGEHTLSRPPRRLVYCLPMRTLVVQTEQAIRRWVRNLESKGRLPQVPAVHVLMGGEPADDWDVHPERDAVLIGTQDILLSRLLNRGYGVRSRYRWPMHLGLLGNDCLWVMDEVQLMGSGLATTVQVDAFQKHFWKPAKPCHFLWMSATLGDSLFSTRDRKDCDIGQIAPDRRFDLEPAEKKESAVKTRIEAHKTIEFWNGTTRRGADPTETLAEDVIARHQPGRMSLVIANTVPAARDLHRAIRDVLDESSEPRPATVLLHSRFRPPDRQRQMDALQKFLGRLNPKTGAVADDPGVIVVSTQVVEAGFDISSIRLWSEIAPWPSVIQRLGRLNREGLQLPDATAIFWMPGKSEEKDNEKGAPNEKRVGPYLQTDLDLAHKLLAAVEAGLADGKGYREALDAVLATAESRTALEVEYEAVIRPHDFLELFETEPDLAGGFTDVSRYIRNQDRNVDAHVFWRATPVSDLLAGLRSGDDTYRSCCRSALCYAITGSREWAFGALRIAASKHDDWARHHHIYGLLHGAAGDYGRSLFEFGLALVAEPHAGVRSRIGEAMALARTAEAVPAAGAWASLWAALPEVVRLLGEMLAEATEE